MSSGAAASSDGPTPPHIPALPTPPTLPTLPTPPTPPTLPTLPTLPTPPTPPTLPTPPTPPTLPTPPTATSRSLWTQNARSGPGLSDLAIPPSEVDKPDPAEPARLVVAGLLSIKTRPRAWRTSPDSRSANSGRNSPKSVVLSTRQYDVSRRPRGSAPVGGRSRAHRRAGLPFDTRP